MRWYLPLLFCLACNSKDSDSKTPAPSEQRSQPASKTPQETVGPETKPVPSGQSFKQGMIELCRSIDQVGQIGDPLERQREVATWINDNVTNAEVRELFSIIGEMPAKQRPGMMSAAATKAGLEHCAIAEQ